MTYSYMDDLDYRLMFIAGLLSDKVQSRNIVDINCGKAPLLKYIRPDYRFYDCNDLYVGVESINPRITFHNLSDEEFTTLLIRSTQPVDVLLALGLVDGRLTGSPEESSTLIDSIIRLAEAKKPEHIILEISARWEQLYHILSNLKKDLREYKTVGEWIITPTNYPNTPEGNLYPRRILHLTHK